MANVNVKDKKATKDKTLVFKEEDYTRLFRKKMDIEYEKGDTIKWGEFIIVLLDDYEKHHPPKK